MALFAQLPREQAAELESDLSARLEEFWGNLPAFVRDMANKESVATKWRLSEGLVYVRAFWNAGPGFRYAPLFAAADTSQQTNRGTTYCEARAQSFRV